MKIGYFLFPLILLVNGASAQSTVGVLGTPPDGSTISGVSTISGYHCTSKNIQVFIDGVSFGPAGAGTQLLGTQDVCGRTDTGYSFLYNFSNLDNGQHTISVTADGIPFGTNTITTVKSGGEQWLTGVSKQTKVPDFPHPGQAATLPWVQSFQNFLVTGIGDTANDLSGLNGTYAQNATVSVSGSSCYLYDFLTGNQTFFATAGALAADPTGIVIYALPTTGNELVVYIMTTNSGNSDTGYNMSGTVVSFALAAQAPAIATGVKKSADGLHLVGTVSANFPGCTQMAVMY